jgi:hypothetical protein
MPEFHESDPFVPVPFSLPQSEKNRLDQRIAKLGLDLNIYLRHLIDEDIAKAQKDGKPK